MKYRRVAGWAFVAIVGLILLYFGVAMLVAARLTSPANEPVEAIPAGIGLDFREVELKGTDGVRLAAWWIPRPGSSRAVVLVHGWNGNKSNGQILATAPVYARNGYNVLMLDLRAHGESGGDRRTLGYKEARDVRGALGWLKEQDFSPNGVVLHGWSMGAATVVRSAPGTGVDAVVEEAGYADLPLLLDDALSESSGLPAFFNSGTMLMAKLFLDFDPWAVVPREEAARLSAEGTPLFIIHSITDETVPFEHARIFRRAYPGARFWKLKGYDHVEAYKHPDYEKRLSDFLRSLERSRAA